VRLDVKERKDKNGVFSDSATHYWGAMADLFMAIDQGDASIGLPPYNGGLFDQERHAILTNIRIPDAVMARVINAQSGLKRTEEPETAPDQGYERRVTPISGQAPKPALRRGCARSSPIGERVC